MLFPRSLVYIWFVGLSSEVVHDEFCEASLRSVAAGNTCAEPAKTVTVEMLSDSTRSRMAISSLVR